MAVACTRETYLSPLIVYPCNPMRYRQMDCEFYKVNHFNGEYSDQCVFRFEGRCCITKARVEADLQSKLEEI